LLGLTKTGAPPSILIQKGIIAQAGWNFPDMGSAVRQVLPVKIRRFCLAWRVHGHER
jgi:hypothetical protein